MERAVHDDHVQAASRTSRANTPRGDRSALSRGVNGIWDVGKGFQLSGVYFYGSGMRTARDAAVPARRATPAPAAARAGTMTARSSSQQLCRARRSIAWTRASSSGSGSAAVARSTASRGVQPARSRELRLVYDGGRQRRVRTTGLQQRRGLCVARGAARFPPRFLIGSGRSSRSDRSDCSRSGGDGEEPSPLLYSGCASSLRSAPEARGRSPQSTRASAATARASDRRSRRRAA